VILSLDEAEAGALARQVAEAVRLAYTARGRPPPHLLLEVARSLRGAARGRVAPLASTPSGLPGGPEVAFLSSSDQPATTLGTDEAARLGEVHPRTIRKWIQRGRVQARRGPRGDLRVDIASLAAYLSERRKEHENRKAA
jgi:hypothetical protein